MNPILQSLIDLNEVDHETVETRQQLERYPKMIDAMDAAEKALKDRIETLTGRIEAARAEGRRLEKDVQALRARIGKYKGQQGAVKTNKEYEAMTQEIERTDGEIDAKETEGLEQLEIEETGENQRGEAEAALKSVVAKNLPERDRIADLIAEKLERQERLTGERKWRREKVDEEWLETYELLHERFPGSACSTIEGDHCVSCQWALVAATVQRVHVGQEIIRCDHCRRILYDKAAR